MDEKEYTVTKIRKTGQDSEGETYEVKIKRKGPERNKTENVPITHKWDSIITYALITIIFWGAYVYLSKFWGRSMAFELLGYFWLFYWFFLIGISFQEEKEKLNPSRKRKSYTDWKIAANILFFLVLILYVFLSFTGKIKFKKTANLKESSATDFAVKDKQRFNVFVINQVNQNTENTLFNYEKIDYSKTNWETLCKIYADRKKEINDLINKLKCINTKEDVFSSLPQILATKYNEYFWLLEEMLKRPKLNEKATENNLIAFICTYSTFKKNQDEAIKIFKESIINGTANIEFNTNTSRDNNIYIVQHPTLNIEQVISRLQEINPKYKGKNSEEIAKMNP